VNGEVIDCNGGKLYDAPVTPVEMGRSREWKKQR
jgi:hypothetical protein